MTVRLTLAELELQPLVRIDGDTTVAATAALLHRTRLGTVLVDTEPLAEVTEDDIVRAVAVGVPHDAPIAAVVHDRPIFIVAESGPEHAVETMLRTCRRSLVVLDPHGRPLGVITLATAVAAVVEGPPWLGALKIALHIERSQP